MAGMVGVEGLDKALRAAKFREDKELQTRLDTEAGEQPEFEEPDATQRAAGRQPRVVRPGTGLRSTGPYEVLGAWSKGDVQVMVEQNTGPNPFAPEPYREVPVTHPPVAVIEGPNGFRVACDPNDHDLVAAEAAAAAGDYSLHERREVQAALLRGGFDADPDRSGSYVRNGLRVTLGLMMLLPGLLLARVLYVLGLVTPGIVTNATKKAWLDAWYSAASLGAPATHYFGLSTTTPAEDGTNVTEPSGNAYARVAMTANSTNFPLSTAADLTPKRNGTVITFPAATGSWGTVTHTTQHDALTAGNVKDWQALTASQAISTGTTASFAANAWESNLT